MALQCESRLHTCLDTALIDSLDTHTVKQHEDGASDLNVP